MYQYIKGIVTDIGFDYAVVEANGIGYKLFGSSNSVSALSMKRGKEAIVYTYLNIAENLMELYGFCTEEERDCFVKLIGISGVGPKAASAILSVFTPETLTNAVQSGDAKYISSAKGIGLKTAQKIIIELKGKLDFGDETKPSGTKEAKGNNISDAVSALTLLGFSRSEANDALSGADGNSTVEELISLALTKLNRL